MENAPERPPFLRRATVAEFGDTVFMTRSQQIELERLDSEIRRVQSDVSDKRGHHSPLARRRRKKTEKVVKRAASLPRTEDMQRRLLRLVRQLGKNGVLKNSREMLELLESTHEPLENIRDALELCFENETLDAIVEFVYGLDYDVWTEDALSYLVGRANALSFTRAVFALSIERAGANMFIREDDLSSQLLGSWMKKVHKLELYWPTYYTSFDLCEDVLLQCLVHFNTIGGSVLKVLRSAQEVLGSEPRPTVLSAVFLRYYVPFIHRHDLAIAKTILSYITNDNPNKELLAGCKKLKASRSVRELYARSAAKINPRESI